MSVQFSIIILRLLVESFLAWALPHATPPKTTEIVIVGAGLSGLATVYQ
ncbi:MAG: hypothetical protein ACPGYT_09320 [Nitrospirales bacterium]